MTIVAVLAGLLLPTAAGSGVASAATGTAASPPSVPGAGAYLGAWLNPNVTQTTTANLLRTVQALSQFDASIGRPLGFVHLYQQGNLTKHAPVSNGTLRAVAATGAVPLIDWPCAIPDGEITGGLMDTAIEKFAQQLASYGGPVFLRWSWEMNLTKLPGNKACQGTGGAKGYVKAWRHIEQLMAPIAPNVAFVWCPSVAPIAATPTAYFPGAGYVTWIGMDGYDRTSSAAKAIAHWQTFYGTFSSYGKPMMIAETGAPNRQAPPNSQADFLAAAQQALTAMPDIKAVGYYDSQTSTNNWTLDKEGLAEFRQLAASPYFSFVTPLGQEQAT